MSMSLSLRYRNMSGTRLFFGGLAAVAAASLLFALFMEHGLGLEPCQLCILQRLMVVPVLVGALAAALHRPGRVGVLLYALGAGLSAAGGAALAIRHLWLQSLPAEQAPECAPDLGYMMEVMPVLDALGEVLRGTGQCSEVVARFLGLTLPGWTLLLFVVLLLACAWAGVQALRRGALLPGTQQ